jgi:hypothetical protein
MPHSLCAVRFIGASLKRPAAVFDAQNTTKKGLPMVRSGAIMKQP